MVGDDGSQQAGLNLQTTSTAENERRAQNSPSDKLVAMASTFVELMIVQEHTMA
jgi:hypothetical protein